MELSLPHSVNEKADHNNNSVIDTQQDHSHQCEFALGPSLALFSQQVIQLAILQYQSNDVNVLEEINQTEDAVLDQAAVVHPAHGAT